MSIDHYWEESDDTPVGRVEFLQWTARAVRVRFEKSGEEAWVPRSQTRPGTADWETEKAGQLIVSSWLARERGWV